MIRRFVASLILAAVAGLVIRSLPDIARYLKMRGDVAWTSSAGCSWG